MKEKKDLLFYKKKRDNFSIIPSSGIGGIRTRVQTPIVKVFYMLISYIICRCITGNEQTDDTLS